MALRIPVQKDIGEYEEKIVGKMSLRTLACVSLGFGSAVGAAAFVHLGLHADAALGGTRALPAAARVRALPRREPPRGLAAPGPPGTSREAQGKEERSRAL